MRRLSLYWNSYGGCRVHTRRLRGTCERSTVLEVLHPDWQSANKQSQSSVLEDVGKDEMPSWARAGQNAICR